MIAPVRSRRPCRGGFTLVEMVCAGGLMALLALLITTAWAAEGRPAVEVSQRGRVAREAALAIAALAADLGGASANLGDRLGGRSQGQFVGWQFTPDNAQLWLCFDGAPPNNDPDGKAEWKYPDTVIIYEVVSGYLVRSDQTAGTKPVVVAGDVASFVVTDPDGLGQQFTIQLTFQYRGVSRIYTLKALKP